MGMVDSQSRNSDALDAHVNASLTALNLAKVTLRQEMTVPRSTDARCDVFFD